MKTKAIRYFQTDRTLTRIVSPPLEGSITIFGDLHRTNLGMRHLESGMKVVLLDKREPEKQGWYLIEEINTKFGVNGFRQTLKLPYCIAKPEKEQNYGR